MKNTMSNLLEHVYENPTTPAHLQSIVAKAIVEFVQRWRREHDDATPVRVLQLINGHTDADCLLGIARHALRVAQQLVDRRPLNALCLPHPREWPVLDLTVLEVVRYLDFAVRTMHGRRMREDAHPCDVAVVDRLPVEDGVRLRDLLLLMESVAVASLPPADGSSASTHFPGPTESHAPMVLLICLSLRRLPSLAQCMGLTNAARDELDGRIADLRRNGLKYQF